LNIKKRKISKEVDQESTKMNILIEKFFKYLGFKTPSLNDYHYRIKQLNEKILKLLLEKTRQHFIEKNQR